MKLRGDEWSIWIAASGKYKNLRSARCLRFVLSKLLAARKANFFIYARARKKIAVLGMLANARKDNSSSLN